MALQPFGPWTFFSFFILYTVGKTPSTGDQPVAKPLPAQSRINAQRHPCLEWDSNPRSQCSSRRRRGHCDRPISLLLDRMNSLENSKWHLQCYCKINFVFCKVRRVCSDERNFWVEFGHSLWTCKLMLRFSVEWALTAFFILFRHPCFKRCSLVRWNLTSCSSS
jgi:hypothetical protein